MFCKFLQPRLGAAGLRCDRLVPKAAVSRGVQVIASDRMCRVMGLDTISVTSHGLCWWLCVWLGSKAGSSPYDAHIQWCHRQQPLLLTALCCSVFGLLQVQFNLFGELSCVTIMSSGV